MGSEENNSVSDTAWALVLHAGAGVLPGEDHSRSEAHMMELLRSGREMLMRGASAVDIVCEMVRELEACGLHVAGKGASPNSEGRWELDAAIMDGEARQAGAVAGLEGIRHPILAARAVMDHTPHVLLAGDGAYQFARDQKLKRVKKPQDYYTCAPTRLSANGELSFGTVGAVALDRDGLLAAATSTGGVLNKMPGRVGDSCIVGAGIWADERVAVSCTGVGEYFMRTSAASDISARIRYGQDDLGKAANGMLENLGFLGGEGGVIAIDRLGRIAMPFNTHGMKRGFIRSNGDCAVKTYL